MIHAPGGSSLRRASAIESCRQRAPGEADIGRGRCAAASDCGIDAHRQPAASIWAAGLGRDGACPNGLHSALGRPVELTGEQHAQIRGEGAQILPAVNAGQFFQQADSDRGVNGGQRRRRFCPPADLGEPVRRSTAYSSRLSGFPASSRAAAVGRGGITSDTTVLRSACSGQ